MRLLQLAFKRETAFPMLALVFASSVSVLLVCARVVWMKDIAYVFLVWNLFLAWLPLVFALLACDEYRTGASRSWRFRGVAVAWLLFFPNAPYIFTDLIHLWYRFRSHFWVDLVLILLCALIGLVIGFLSLYLMQSVVARMAGRLASWLFIAGVAGLSGFAVSLGRFLRFNSWDVLVQPLALCRSVGFWVENPRSFGFPILFGTFLFVTYLMLYALTHLQPAMPVAVEQQAGAPERT
jgi:uncharacterized membrane protein